MRILLTVIAIILVGSLILNGWFIWDRGKALELRYTENEQFQNIIADNEDSIKTAVGRINEVEARRVKDSLSFKSLENGLKIDLARYKAKASQLRPQVQAKIDSFPDLREFVAAQDLVIIRQDSLIRAQDLFCAAQIRDFNEILALHQQKFVAQAEISDAWMQTAAAAQQDAHNEKRRKGFWKVTSFLLAGGIIWMAVKE